MPSKSPKQAKLMNIAAHTPGGYGGVPQAVGAEFHAADQAKARTLNTVKQTVKPTVRVPKIAVVKAPLTRNQGVAAIRKKGPRMGY
jgi:hypothetical protein